jgi:hypothetical protein
VVDPMFPLAIADIPHHRSKDMTHVCARSPLVVVQLQRRGGIEEIAPTWNEMPYWGYLVLENLVGEEW